MLIVDCRLIFRFGASPIFNRQSSIINHLKETVMKKMMNTALALMCLGQFTGCNQKPSVAPTTENRQSSIENPQGHGHGSGPHEGTVADWGGGKFHVEFTVDHEKQEGTVYVLGSDEKSPVPIDAQSIDLSINDPVMQVTLKASPIESDPPGKASRFIGNHEKLGVVQEYAGTIAGVIDGTPYSGDFAEEAHGN